MCLKTDIVRAFLFTNAYDIFLSFSLSVLITLLETRQSYPLKYIANLCAATNLKMDVKPPHLVRPENMFCLQLHIYYTYILLHLLHWYCNDLLLRLATYSCHSTANSFAWGHLHLRPFFTLFKFPMALSTVNQGGSTVRQFGLEQHWSHFWSKKSFLFMFLRHRNQGMHGQWPDRPGSTCLSAIFFLIASTFLVVNLSTFYIAYVEN